MLAQIQSITVKPTTEKSSGQTFRIVGSVTEPIIERSTAGDKAKRGIVTLQIQGGASWGCECKMTAKYKLTDSGGTEITWSVVPDDPLDDDRIRLIAKDVRMEQVYLVTFAEAGRHDEHKAK